MKKALSLILTAVMLLSIFSCVPVVTHAAEPTGSCGANATYSFDAVTKKLTISGTGAMDDYYLSDPGYYGIRDSILSIEVGDGITYIGLFAFYNLRNATAATIGSGTTVIARSAFERCTSLSTVTIGEGARTIGKDAFLDCGSLSDVYFCGNENVWNASVEIVDNGNDALLQATLYCKYGTCGANVNYTFDFESGKLTLSGSGAMADYEWNTSPFYLKNKITTLVIEEGITKIGKYAFRECKGLSKVFFPASLIETGYYSFLFDYLLQDVYYSGTQERWNEKVTVTTAEDSLSAARFHCFPSDPYNYSWNDDGSLNTNNSSLVSSVRFVVREPRVDCHPAFSYAEESDKYVNVSAYWHDDTADEDMTNKDYFVAGHLYTIKQYVRANTTYGYRLLDPLGCAYINGEPANFGYNSASSSVLPNCLYITRQFKCEQKTIIPKIEFNWEKPGNNRPKEEIVPTFMAEGIELVDYSVKRYQEDIHGNRTEYEFDTYEWDKTYTLTAHLKVLDGYQLKLFTDKDSPTGVPDGINIEKKINTTVYYTKSNFYDQGDTHLKEWKNVDFVFDFKNVWEPEDVSKLIDSIYVQVKEPVVGQAFQNLEYDELQYHISLGWAHDDSNDQRPMQPGEVFEENHSYEFYAIATPRNGYCFAEDEQGRFSAVSVYVNGYKVNSAWRDYAPPRRDLAFWGFYRFLTTDTTNPLYYDRNQAPDSVNAWEPPYIHYTVPTFAGTDTQVNMKGDTALYTFSGSAGIFVKQNVPIDIYRVYAKQKNTLRVYIGNCNSMSGKVVNTATVTFPLGDVNGDDVIDFADISVLLTTANYGKHNSEIDLTGDGMITVKDISTALLESNYAKCSVEIV